MFGMLGVYALRSLCVVDFSNLFFCCCFTMSKLWSVGNHPLLELVASRSGTILVRIWYQYGTILAQNRIIFKIFLQLLRLFSCNSDCIFGLAGSKT